MYTNMLHIEIVIIIIVFNLYIKEQNRTKFDVANKGSLTFYYVLLYSLFPYSTNILS